ncbi:MAG: IS21-like element helper ATPase IstB [Nitrospirales bacterium]
MTNSLLHKEILTAATHLRLPTVAREANAVFQKTGHCEALEALLEVLQMEVSERQGRRVERLRHASRLPEGKTFSTLDKKVFPRHLVSQLKDLATGSFVESSTNVLAFGLPGVGKTHAVSGLGHALIDAGIPVYFTPTFRLVQELLVAKRDYALPRALRKLDLFDVLILDDIGYVQQNQEEMEVLFTLLAERYERRSTVITSNLVFSQWEQIFKNPLTTAAAIDRVVHHSVILEFNVRSFRGEEAKKRARAPEGGEELAAVFGDSATA